MTIAEHSQLSGTIPPLPNQVIDLKEIHKLKFFNTSFREYLAIYNNYIIGVYPFAIKIEHAFDTDNNSMTYEFFKLMGVRSHHHHIDFTENKIDIDPCDIFEQVCGIKIHDNISDEHLMNIDHTNDIKAFESEIISQRRNNKLNKILISDNH